MRRRGKRSGGKYSELRPGSTRCPVCLQGNSSIYSSPKTVNFCSPYIRAALLPRLWRRIRSFSSKSSFTSATRSCTSERSTSRKQMRRCVSGWLRRLPRFSAQWTRKVVGPKIQTTRFVETCKPQRDEATHTLPPPLHFHH